MFEVLKSLNCPPLDSGENDYENHDEVDGSLTKGFLFILGTGFRDLDCLINSLVLTHNSKKAEDASSLKSPVALREQN